MIKAANSADRAAGIASQTLINSENTFKDEQRAWVGALGATDIVVKENEPISFRVVVTNSGKTPALHLRFLTGSRGAAKGQRIKFVYDPVPKDQIVSDFVLQPGSQYLLPSGDPKSLPNKAAVGEITSGAFRVYIFGRMTYEDVSKRSHHTKFCFVISPDLKNANACDTYNEAD